MYDQSLTVCRYHWYWGTDLFGTLQCPVSSLKAFNLSNISSHRSFNVETVSTPLVEDDEKEFLRLLVGLTDGSVSLSASLMPTPLWRRRRTAGPDPLVSSFSDTASMTIRQVKNVLGKLSSLLHTVYSRSYGRCYPTEDLSYSSVCASYYWSTALGERVCVCLASVNSHAAVEKQSIQESKSIGPRRSV